MPLTLTRWMRAALLTTLGTASATPALPASSVAAQAVRDALAPAASAPQRNVPAVRVPQPAQPQSVQRAVRPVQTPVTRTPAQAARPAPIQAARPAPTPAARPAQTQTVRPVHAPAARRAPVQAARPAQAQAARAAQTRVQNIRRAQAEVARPTTRTGRSAIVRATAYNSLANQTDSTPFITATGTRTRPGVVALSRDMLRTFPYGTRITIEDLSGRSSGLFRGRVFIVEDTMAARKTGSLDIWLPAYGDAIRFGARQVRITAVR